MFQPRSYRRYTESKDMVSFRTIASETDLFISADKDLTGQAESCVGRLRRDLEDYIIRHADFKDSFKPLDADKGSPQIIEEMVSFSKKCGVGPMASVAGAVAEAVGRELLKYSSQVIVENGGDIFISSLKSRLVRIYAGDSRFNKKITLEIAPEDTPCGICTSSGTVGHSLSFGKADAIVVLSESASLADAAATSVCNRVKEKEDIERAIEYARGIGGITGILIVIGDALGAWGRMKLVDM